MQKLVVTLILSLHFRFNVAGGYETTLDESGEVIRCYCGLLNSVELVELCLQPVGQSSVHRAHISNTLYEYRPECDILELWHLERSCCRVWHRFRMQVRYNIKNAHLSNLCAVH